MTSVNVVKPPGPENYHRASGSAGSSESFCRFTTDWHGGCHSAQGLLSSQRISSWLWLIFKFLIFLDDWKCLTLQSISGSNRWFSSMCTSQLCRLSLSQNSVWCFTDHIERLIFPTVNKQLSMSSVTWFMLTHVQYLFCYTLSNHMGKYWQPI